MLIMMIREKVMGVRTQAPKAKALGRVIAYYVYVVNVAIFTGIGCPYYTTISQSLHFVILGDWNNAQLL